MKIQFVSDVHCEFHRDQGEWWAKNLPVRGDVLVLAGDIVTKHMAFPIIRILAQRFPQIVYLCGNHEYYGSNRSAVHNALTKLQNQNRNFHWLNNRVVVIDGQRFVGTTLWWDAPPSAYQTIRHMLSDFRTIQGYASWVSKANQVAKLFLKENVQEGDVVITHHAPTWQACPPKSPAWGYGSTADLDFQYAYYNNLDPLIIEQKPKLWIFGHTHERFNQIIEETLVTNSPYGYVNDKEDARFDIYGVVNLEQAFLHTEYNGEPYDEH